MLCDEVFILHQKFSKKKNLIRTKRFAREHGLDAIEML